MGIPFYHYPVFLDVILVELCEARMPTGWRRQALHHSWAPLNTVRETEGRFRQQADTWLFGRNIGDGLLSSALRSTFCMSS